jgi:hypothetical protein
MNLRIIEINARIATVVITNLGTIRLNLISVHAVIARINGNVADIKTSTRTIRNIGSMLTLL